MREGFHNDAVLFDRLVDGELPDAERRTLLSSLDERPDGWRRCALAFLEAQSWRGDLTSFLQGSAGPAEDAGLKRASVRGAAGPRGLAWLAVAASVAAAFTLGVLQGGRGPSTATVAPQADRPLAIVAPPQRNVSPESAPADDALTFWVRDDAGQTRPLRVPLVEAGALDRQLGVRFQSAMPAAIRERLQQRGYDVQTRRRYAPLWLENGRPMILPVEDTKIVPVGQHVY
jgi:hypothetical protein